MICDNLRNVKVFLHIRSSFEYMVLELRSPAVHLPISGQYSDFIPPENTRKLKVLWCFQGGIKWEYWPEKG